MSYLLSFIALDLINPFGLDCFILPKILAMSLLVVWYESYKENNWIETSMMLLLSVIILFLSLDWSTSILGCELMGFGGLIQLFIYYEVFKISKDNLYKSKSNDPGQAIILFLIPMLAYAVLQRLGYDYQHPNWSIPYHRAVSTQGNPVFLSITIGMLAPIFFNSIKGKWSDWGLIGLLAGGLWAANSKSGWLAMVVGTIMYITRRQYENAG